MNCLQTPSPTLEQPFKKPCRIAFLRQIMPLTLAAWLAPHPSLFSFIVNWGEGERGNPLSIGKLAPIHHRGHSVSFVPKVLRTVYTSWLLNAQLNAMFSMPFISF